MSLFTCRIRPLCSLSWMALVVLFAAGCGGSPSDGVTRRDVLLKITFGGAPIAVARVDLEPASPDGKLMAMGGELGPDSTVTIPGVATGTYQVVITPGVVNPLPDGSGPPVVEHADIPQKFRLATTTPLTVNVTDNQSNFEFDLKTE